MGIKTACLVKASVAVSNDAGKKSRRYWEVKSA